MPYKPEEVSKETKSSVIAEKEPTSPPKLTKPMLHDSGDKKSTCKQNEVNGGSEIHGKGINRESVVKTIPVKQVEQSEVLDGKKEEAAQRHDSDAKQKKITQEGGKSQSSSPTKSSKLPPVCLRVDPLPRKKSSNGNSRSPSPPGGKGKLVESRNDSIKPPILSKEKEHVQLDKSSTTTMPEKNIEVEPSKSKTKVVEVAQGKTEEDKLQDQSNPDLKHQARSQTGQGDTSKAANEPKDQPDRVAAKAKSSNEGHQRGQARESVNGDVDGGNEMKREKRSQLYDDKAATMIQSRYRGFNVRRWEPLKKLKQIAKIEEQLDGIKKRIQELESSAVDGIDNKQRTIITEVIMGLLLKLDTVQGLLPTVREYRKSVAKELVSLQEKLDLLNCKKQPAESEQTLTAKSSEDTCTTMEDNISLQDGLEVQKLEQGADLAKGDEGIKFDTNGPSGEQPLRATEMLPNSDVGNAGVLVGKEENKEVEEVMEDVSGSNAVKMGDGASVKPSFESKVDDKLLDEDAVVVEKLEEHGEDVQSLPKDTPVSEELPANFGSEVRGCGFKEKGEGVNELEELPLGVLDEETNFEGSAEIRKDLVLPYDEGDLTAFKPEERDSNTASLEHNHLEALGETPVILGSEDITNTEESETAGALQEKMQNALDRDIEILDSGKTIEQAAEPQLSTVTNDEAQEHHIQDKQKVGDENKEVQGEELAHNDAVVSKPDNEGIEHNVEVEQRHVEENFEMQGKEPVPNDNAASVTDQPGDSSKAMAAPTSEAATTETELSEEKELGEAEDTTCPLTCDAVEGNSADASQSFDSMPPEVQVTGSNEFKEWKKVDMSPSSPTASQLSCNSDALSENDRKLIEENEKLREMMEKLIKSGNEQLSAISSLSGRVKDLEKRLSRKKKLKLKRNKLPAAGSTCVKPSNDSLQGRAVGLAM